MILLIDNYDSFTFNLYQYLGEIDSDVVVKRNDEITIGDIKKMSPDIIVISPGPGRPEDSGICIDVVRDLGETIPILGICLGHQVIGYAYGASIVNAPTLMHGKVSNIYHTGHKIFEGINTPFDATRYHSLIIDSSSLPDVLEVIAHTDDDIIMGIAHKEYRVVGLQFHPESILTTNGKDIIKNFYKLYGSAKKKEYLDVNIKNAISKVVGGKDLSQAEMQRVMDAIMSGQATDAQIGGLLVALRMKGESIDEIAGSAIVMRNKARRVKLPPDMVVVDNCGTGGDKSSTFNISTCSAFVVAGAGVRVVKHGNRSVSSKSGSADVLEALGANIKIPPELASKMVRKVGITFLFAPIYHEAMKHAIGPRRQLGMRSIFNIIGPLSNPALVKHQLIGVYDRELLLPMASVCKRLGMERAYIVHGSDGLDEITLTSTTYMAELKDGWIREFEFDPRDIGFDYCSLQELKGGNAKENAAIILDILEGKESGAKRDIVILNAAFVIMLSGVARDMDEAISLASYSIDGGGAYDTLNKFIAMSKEASL